MVGHDVEGPRRLSVCENRSRYSVTEKLGDDLFHGAGAEGSVKAVADVKSQIICEYRLLRAN